MKWFLGEQVDHSQGSSSQDAERRLEAGGKEFRKRQQVSVLLVFLQPSSATLWQVWSRWN